MPTRLGLEFSGSSVLTGLSVPELPDEAGAGEYGPGQFEPP
ncbi:hypothetical protein [Duganella sp. CF458]|nr:hypothetical protein [Duganella sp. CF458]